MTRLIPGVQSNGSIPPSSGPDRCRSPCSRSGGPGTQPIVSQRAPFATPDDHMVDQFDPQQSATAVQSSRHCKILLAVSGVPGRMIMDSDDRGSGIPDRLAEHLPRRWRRSTHHRADSSNRASARESTPASASPTSVHNADRPVLDPRNECQFAIAAAQISVPPRRQQPVGSPVCDPLPGSKGNRRDLLFQGDRGRVELNRCGTRVFVI